MEIYFDTSSFGSVVDMACLKILLAVGRPTTVHASRLRLYKPLARL